MGRWTFPERRGTFDENMVLAIAAEEQTLRARKKAPYLTWIWHSSPSPPPLFSTEEKRKCTIFCGKRSRACSYILRAVDIHNLGILGILHAKTFWKNFFALLFSSFPSLHSSFLQLVFPVGKWVGSPSPVFAPPPQLRLKEGGRKSSVEGKTKWNAN